jgi:hypothetical protein
MQNFHSNINMARQQHPRSSSKRTAKTKKAEKTGKTDFDDFDCVIVERPSHEIDRFGKIREVSNDPGPLQNKSPVPSQPAPKKAPAKKSCGKTCRSERGKNGGQGLFMYSLDQHAAANMMPMLSPKSC